MSNSLDRYLFVKKLRNIQLFDKYQRSGVDYLLNPQTFELHRVQGGDIRGSHLLIDSNLEEFYWIINIGIIPIDFLFDGSLVPFYDIESGDLIGNYPLNKCKHCFPKQP